MKTNKIKTTLKGFALVLLLAGSAACTNSFNEYNKLEDEPSPEQIPGPIRNGLAIQSMSYVVVPVIKNRYQVSENMLGGAYGRYFAYAQAASQGWNQSFAYYNTLEKWHDAVFNDTMTDIYANWTQVREISGAQGLSYAWAQIIRIAAMHRLTDIFGPIPYSKMGEGSGIVTEYDSQEQAYTAMFEDLDKAIDEIAGMIAANPSDRSMAEYDYIYFGDFSKWLQFANSLKLRMAMRLVYSAPALAQQKAEEAVRHVYGVILTNDDNAAITVVQTGDQNPLWWLVESYNDCMSSAEIVTYMKSLNDPRLEKYFAKSAKESATSGTYNGLRVSSPSLTAWRNNYSLPIVDKAKDKVMWLSAAEVAFLRAEMALYGWDAGDSAQKLYEEGIRLSFGQWSADMGGYAAYIADGKSTPQSYTDPQGTYTYTPATPYSVTIAWNDGATQESKLEKIITQKWIALYPLGTEAWCEQRRTGYPRFYPTLSNKSQEPNLDRMGAARIPFPPSEQRRNPEHYAKAVQLLGGGDLYGTRLWWDVKTNKPTW